MLMLRGINALAFGDATLLVAVDNTIAMGGGASRATG